MRILFDYQALEYQKFGGISRYYVELINRLSLKYKIEIGIKFSNNQYLKEKQIIPIKPFVDIRQEFIKGFEFYGKGRIFNLLKSVYPSKYYDCYQTNRECSIGLLKRQDFEVFHPTYFDDYFLEFIGKKPFVLTIHDMTHEKFPEFFPITDKTGMKKKKLAQKASHIISVSENTKKDIISFWGIEEEKITVIYHSVNLIENSDYSHISIPKDYVLFIGARNGYKNFLFFIYSIAGIIISNNISLICTGIPFSNEEIELFKNLNISDRVFHHYASDSEMVYLYKNAIAFIFPSLYEGFGIPILEAFANDCPVILSNTSCLPEIAGDAALYFDPKECNEIRAQVIRITNDRTLRRELIEKGRARLVHFSWEKFITKHEDIYKAF
jgi:glycosyltransferase involved in cell wall biosynthesis